MEKLSLFEQKKKSFYYLSTASEDIKQNKKEVVELNAQLSVLENSSLSYMFDNFEGATHYSLVTHSIPNALEGIFSGFQPITRSEYINKILALETSPVDYLIEKKVKKIIYASSDCSYWIKKEKKVKVIILKLLFSNNLVKMVTERLLISYKEKINVVIVRPATVCGISKRMRLDVSVNALTFQALKNKTINVFGGSQKRPNIHIDDITDLYIFFLKNKIKFGISSSPGCPPHSKI